MGLSAYGMGVKGGSMINIVIIPPGKTSKLVISFSLCECHMYV